jgi:hypothetical protein
MGDFESRCSLLVQFQDYSINENFELHIYLPPKGHYLESHVGQEELVALCEPQHYFWNIPTFLNPRCSLQRGIIKKFEMN